MWDVGDRQKQVMQVLFRFLKPFLKFPDSPGNRSHPINENLRVFLTFLSFSTLLGHGVSPITKVSTS